MKVAVAGSGIHGSCCALTLATRGHEVTVFEQFSLSHDRGSSHGESRIVRKAYPDRFYTSLMAEAYPLWRDLETRSGQSLLHEVGLCYFGSEASANLRTVVDGLSDVAEPFQVLRSETVSQVSPLLRLTPSEIAVFSPGAGWVDAAQSVATVIELARRAGASFEISTRVDIELLSGGFDAFVVAPGAWIRDWVPDLDVKVTLQTVGFFEADIPGPVWIEDSEKLAYGFPTHDRALGAKLAFHSYGRQVDPAETDRSPDLSLISDLEFVLETRFGQSKPELRLSYGCLYTNTPDEDFRIGHVEDTGFYVSACSGHGFKFGPWIGRLMADLVEGKRAVEEFPRFCKSGSR